MKFPQHLIVSLIAGGLTWVIIWALGGPAWARFASFVIVSHIWIATGLRDDCECHDPEYRKHR